MPSTGICRLIAEALLIRFLAISFVLWLSGTIRASIVVVDSRDNIYGAGLSSTPDILGDGMSPAVVNFAAAPNQVLTFPSVVGTVNYYDNTKPSTEGPDG
jgi:hypothetical protein